MISARNVTIVTLAIACLSIVGVTYSYLITPEPGRLGGDSYGTRAHGQRALVELLLALDIPVQRCLRPPIDALGKSITLVLLGPDLRIVQAEPVYLQQVAKWVRAGGRVVVAPQEFDPRCRSNLYDRKTDIEGLTVLQALGLNQLEIGTFDLKWSRGKESSRKESLTDGAHRDEFHEDTLAATPSGPLPELPDDFSELAVSALNAKETSPIGFLSVHMSGDFASFGNCVTSLCVPQERLQVLVERQQISEPHGPESELNAVSKSDSDQEPSDRQKGELTNSKTSLRESVKEPAGQIYAETDNDTHLILAASYRCGQGEVVVLGDPVLIENRLLALGDNSVLACQLLARHGDEIVLDEFYHGLAQRGNPLWLMRRPHFQLLTIMLLVWLGLWAWRNSLRFGPSLVPVAVARRSWGEYVDAMARFISRSRTSKPFVLKQLRDGVLWHLRKKLHLHSSQEELEEVVAALACKQPQAAEELRQAVHAIDRQLEKKQVGSDKQVVQTLQALCHALDV